MSDEPEIDLSAWGADEPPPGFADRVVAALHAPVAPAPRRRGAIVVGFVAGALVAAAIAFVAVREPTPGATAGARVATARESIALGRRGVAVAEPGASLAWEVAAGGAARVEQSAGDVFYRVEPGGPFVVATAAGDVRVTGTCFRVEVQMKPSKSSLAGAAIGAALAATVVVTVYEGGVVVADRGGAAERAVAAGERVVLGDGSPAVAAAAAPPAADVTRDELLARDATQRQTIQELATRVAGLERQLAAGAAGDVRVGVRGGAGLPYRGDDDDGDGRPWFDPSPELLAQFAAECRIRFDTPPVDGSEPFQLTADRGAEAGLSADETARVNEVLRDLHARWKAFLVELYIEVTGDADRADSLSPSALSRELEDKAVPGDAAAVRERIARERAGLETPPTDLSKASAIERYYRRVTALGDETERALAAVLGPERARAVRAHDGGWGWRSEMSGCADER